MSDQEAAIHASQRRGWLSECANAACTTGWLQIWRNRQAPIFEKQWACSEGCMRALVASAVARETRNAGPSAPLAHVHRVPLGLVLMSQGAVEHSLLRAALKAQRMGETHMRIGEWLVAQGKLTEAQVARGLGEQWSCPVLPEQGFDATLSARLVPRILSEAFGALPLRVAGGVLLYVAFRGQIDPCVSLAIEQVTGLRVEAGVMEDSLFDRCHAALLAARTPRLHLLEAERETALVHALSRTLESARPVEARLVRVHDFIWLRMWHTAPTGPYPTLAQVEDVICSLGRGDAPSIKMPSLQMD
jgi:hypothetical protein